MFELVSHLRRAAPHAAGAYLAAEIIRIRHHANKTACVDDTRRTHSHTIGTDKIQITANTVVFDSVHRTLYVNFALDQIHHVFRFYLRMVLHMKIHIGNVTLGNFEFLETVIAKIYPVIAQYLLGIDIMYIPARGQGLVICILYGGSKTRHGLQQNSNSHQRHDPLGCGAGISSTLRRNSQLTPRCCLLRAAKYLQQSLRALYRQTLHDGAYVIFTVVLCNLRYHHIAFSCFAPDDFVNLVHGFYLSFTFPLLTSFIISGTALCRQSDNQNDSLYTAIKNYLKKINITTLYYNIKVVSKINMYYRKNRLTF